MIYSPVCKLVTLLRCVGITNVSRDLQEKQQQKEFVSPCIERKRKRKIMLLIVHLLGSPSVMHQGDAAHTKSCRSCVVFKLISLSTDVKKF